MCRCHAVPNVPAMPICASFVNSAEHTQMRTQGQHPLEGQGGGAQSLVSSRQRPAARTHTSLCLPLGLCEKNGRTWSNP